MSEVTLIRWPSRVQLLFVIAIIPMLASIITRMSASTTPKHLTRPLLQDLHDWWLRGVPTRQDESVPMETFKGWFGSSDDLDSMCRNKYGSAVEEAGQMSSEDIDKVVKSKEEAVGAVLLLDQIPRNIFRGKEAAKAYTIYDPRAVHLARKYLQDRGYSQRDQFSHFTRGMFLYMPLMHSEDLKDHDYFRTLLQEREAACTSEEERKVVANIKFFEEKHRESMKPYDSAEAIKGLFRGDYGGLTKEGAVLEKFGRYPSRNEALGRESTDKEKEHLESGAGW